MRVFGSFVAFGAAASVFLVACRDAAPVRAISADIHGTHATPANAADVSGDVQRQIAELRALTARFHTFDVAVEAGWSTQITGCFENATVGGMGYHYGNVALIDGTVDARAPELLLYEPQKNGKLRFVAVEYVVPFAAWTGAEPPQLYGQSFHRNEAFGIWALHVWHERHNPRGMFADWNPKVNCDNAP
jgi:hypothetical protein